MCASSIKSFLWTTAALFSPATPFAPRSVTRKTLQLYEVIRGDGIDAEPFDIGLGGVRLAEESAIKITGEIKHKPGSADAKPMDLLRYNNLKPIDESRAGEILSAVGAKILGTGAATELYKDPGEGLEKIVKYAPIEAAKEVVNGAASAIECQSIVVNFLGGDDLILDEVLEAANVLTVDMDIATKAKLTFNSVCHNSIPSGTCSVTAVSLGTGSNEEAEFAGLEKSVAAGELYSHDGTWYSLDASEINTALA